MIDFNRGPSGPNMGRRRPNKNVYTTRSGKTIKLNQSISERIRAGRNARATRKAAYLSTLPKHPLKRILYRLQPKRLAAYWFSREGALMALKITGIGIVVCFFISVGVFAYFRKDLPKIKDISGDRIGGSLTYYDRTGTTVLWQDYEDTKRIPVAGTEMSDYVKKATIAVEDKDFYKHGAFDVQGILRAGIVDVIKGEAAQGGSTITQQLVKLNQDWSNDRTITRKVKELILAVELEREYSKTDILTGYLNIAPYGGVEHGVESAARDYFGTTAKNLTLAQSAFLAAIPKSPGIFSPYNSPKYNPSSTEDNFDEEALINRQHYVLDRMVDEKMITKQQAIEAKKVDLLATIQPIKPKYEGIQAPYFVLAAKNELKNKYGKETIMRGGWRVITTLDMTLQKKAEEEVAEAAPRIKRFGGDAAAFVAADVKTGQIVSLIGGLEFGNKEQGGYLNFGAKEKVSPGSSFKPYDYAALINYSNNVGAGSVLYDTQGALPGWSCTNKNDPRSDKRDAGEGGPNCLWNYDFLYPGPITLRYALGGSRNVPAVKAMLTVGTDKTIKMASDMMGNSDAYNCYKDGVDVNEATKADEEQCFGSAAIGDGAYLRLDDHVTGLATMSRNGALLPKTYILKITDGSGKPVNEFKAAKPKQIIKPDAAYIVNMMASDPNASYMNASAKFHTQKNGWHFAIKTGTTNDNFDGLMTSWSTQYATVSWIGYHTRQKPIVGTAMENITGPINRGWMEAAHANLKAENWVAPTGIKTMPAFVVRNKVSRLGEIVPSPSNDLFPSWYQARSGNTTQTTDRVTNKVATSCTPELARQTLGNSNANSWNVDQWAGGRANSSTNNGSTSTRTATATDDIHNCNDSPPSVTITAPPTCNADEGGCTITATVAQGTHALTEPSRSQFPGTLNFTVNGQVVKAFTDITDSPSTRSFTYLPDAGGEITITAQIIDSVLYQATDKATFTAEAATPNLTITAPSEGEGVGSSVTIRWDGGKPNFTVQVTGTAYTKPAQTTADNSATFNGFVSGVTYTAKVTDATGKSATVNFKK